MNRKQFEQWLKSDETTLECQVNPQYNFHHYFLKLKKTENFFYVFVQKNYNESGLTTKGDISFAGTFHKSAQVFYDARNEMQGIFGMEEYPDEYLKKDFELRVIDRIRESINSRIDDDRTNLKITTEAEINDTRLLHELKRYREFEAKADARKMFLQGKTAEDIKFDCNYFRQELSDDCFLAALSDEDAYCVIEADYYYDCSQEWMLTQFLKNDALKEKLQAIIDNPADEACAVRGIIAGVSSGDYKTVNVTIVKDGKELTFKSEAGIFRKDCEGHYCTTRIAAPDRRAFEALYGRSADYKPNDIVMITYGGKTLYQKEKK